jgi:multisite-specific tRNA:(cytosine-C5)-methyltransferase
LTTYCVSLDSWAFSKSLNLTSDFPLRNVLVRNPDGDPVRALYLTNDIVKSIVQNNDYTRIRLTACGTKVLTKQEGGKNVEAQFRVLGEGLPVILPYTDTNSIMIADIPALKTMLEVYYPLCTAFSQPFRSDIEKKGLWSHLGSRVGLV